MPSRLTGGLQPLLQHAHRCFHRIAQVFIGLHVQIGIEAKLGERRNSSPVEPREGVLGTDMAQQLCHLDDIHVINLGRITGKVQVLSRNTGDWGGKIPATQNPVAKARVGLLDDLIEDGRIGQQLVVGFRIGKNRLCIRTSREA